MEIAKIRKESPTRWPLLVIGLLMIIVLIGGTWFYRSQDREMRRRAIEELQAVARMKLDQIVAWRAAALADAVLLMESPFLAEGVSAWMDRPETATLEKILGRVRSMRRHKHYADVLIVDASGKIHLSLDGKSVRLHSEALQAVEDALRLRRPVITELHRGPGDLPPHLDIVAPVFRMQGGVAEPAGAIVLREDARQTLYPLIQSWLTPSPSAETLLVRRDQDHVLFLNDLRFRKGAALDLRIPLTRTDVPAVMAVRGSTGVVEGKDYRGVEVLSVLNRIPNSPWLMVAKVDAKEVFAFWRFQAVLIAALILALMAAMAVAAGALIQRNKKVYFRDLFRTREALLESEARHRMILMSVGDGVLVTDSQGRVTMLNPVAETLTGWRQDEAVGRSIEEVFRIINEETRASVESPVPKVLREGRIIGLANHTLLIAKDGAEFPIADSGAPIRTPDGAISGVVLVFRDQRAERAADEFLRRSEQQFRDLFTRMLEGFALHEIICDETGRPTDYRFLQVNPAFEHMTGLSASAIVGRTVREVMPGIESHWIDTYGEVALTGRPIQLENYTKELDRHYRISAFCPSPGQFAVSFEDITSVKRAEAEKEQLQAQLLQAQKMEAIGRLAGGVAHDFNNMLSIILGYGDMLLEAAPPDHPFRESLKEVVDAGMRAKSLTRQLLAYGRKQMLEMKTAGLNQIIRNFEKLLRRTIGEDIRMQLMLSPEDIPVRVDIPQMEQVLMNLAVNARDAMPEGGVLTIETDINVLDEAYAKEKPGVSPGTYAMMAISDNGCGMDPETQAKIFDPFFTTKDMDKGTGLGLSMVYGIVKQHGGNVWVYSEPGQGSTFKIYLPVASKTPSVEVEIPETAPAPVSDTTVLVVEDEPTVRRLVCTMLKKGGFHVLEADGAPAAIELADNYKGHIHLVLSDVVMPEMKGNELAQRIVALHPEAKALFMSGYTENVIFRQGILDRGVQFIQKPFSAKGLREKVQKAITNS